MRYWILAVLCCFSAVESYAEGRLEGKVALLVGASKGIGRATTELFAREGAKVVAVARSTELLEEICAKIQRNGGEAVYLEGDIANEEDMKRACAEANRLYGRIDILCQNAGIYPRRYLDQLDGEFWDYVMDVNLKGTFNAVSAVLPYMRKQGAGSIVLTSSISGPRVGLSGQCAYTASKAGMNGFMRSAAVELAPQNIRINCVEPGTIMTEGLSYLTAAQCASVCERVPMGRIGEPEDIAAALLFLASDEAGYITGQSIIVDGGQVLPET